MNVLEIILLALALVIAFATLADRLRVPYPIMFLVGGIVVALIPGLPHVNFDPAVIFLLFIPPLVFSAGWRISWRDFQHQLWPITLLSTGLVFATMLVVAVVAHLTLIGLSWPAAFVLGAVLASTDSIAATAILQRLHLARGVEVVLEGESLGNDAASLVAYRTAVTATVTGVFVWATAGLQLILDAIGGVAIGVAVALIYDWIQHRIHNTSAEVALTLVVPFAAYLPAEHFGVSGILAVLTAGVLGSRRVLTDREAASRLAATSFWDSLIFVLNGLIFILLGFYLPGIVSGVAHVPIGQLIADAAVVLVAILVVRAAWVFATPYVPVPPSRHLREGGRGAVWKPALVITWAGMRGADALVLALALPFSVANGAPFPGRSLIIFLTFSVITVTLLAQGLSLPLLIRRLGLHGDETVAREEAIAEAAADRAALRRLDELPEAGEAKDGTATDDATEELAEHLHHTFERSLRRHEARSHGTRDQEAETEAHEARHLKVELLRAQREAVISLRDQGKIGDDVMRELLEDLDLEEQRLQ